MAVLKLARDRQDTLSSVITEAQNAMAAQRKFRLQARKYRKEAKALALAQRDARDFQEIAKFRLGRWIVLSVREMRRMIR